jgi:hypothetical protein
MYKMATAGVPSGTILAVHLQKCSHLSKKICIEFQYNKTINAVNIIITGINCILYDLLDKFGV